MSSPPRFAVIGLEHPHAYAIALALTGAGAEPVGFHTDDDDAAAAFTAIVADTPRASSAAQLVGDDTVDVVVTVGVPSERADVSVRALRAGRAVLSAKPAVTTSEQLTTLRQARDDTGGLFAVWFSERVESRATERALRLVGDGAIGDVVHVTGFGPHRLGLEARPPWFLDPERNGGVLNDLGSHQIDQFLHFAGRSRGNVADVEVAASLVANRAHPHHPTLEDHGEVVLRTPDVTGFVRVDWFTPAALPSWGDVRLFVTGTRGTIEVRKNVDPAGRAGGEHLILVDEREVRHVDCTGDPLPFAAAFLRDVRRGEMTHAVQEHYFAVCELALRAQAGAVRAGHLPES